jgi:hypothetical protein
MIFMLSIITCPFYKPYDNSVAQALELYVADYSLSQLAKELGKMR